LCISPEFLTVKIDDAKIAIVNEFGPVDSFALVRVSGDLLFNDWGWDSQDDIPVTGAARVIPR
jgi:hypothetical protein